MKSGPLTLIKDKQFKAMGDLPVGKLPPELLERILSKAPILDLKVLMGPGIGLDCAVIEHGDTCLVFKSDPITFISDDIGWYAVQINANDIATTGATPRWFMQTLLLPQGQTTIELLEKITSQVYSACEEIGVSVIGGHTEITYGLDRPILVGTMIGEVKRNQLVTPRGAKPGDRLLLTKGVPVEATAILGREFPDRLTSLAGNGEKYQSPPLQHPERLTSAELNSAQDYIYDPGISVIAEASLATRTAEVHAMHDPTEGGLYAALWELADACGCSLEVNLSKVPVSPLSKRICRILEIDPLAAIASGALILATPPQAASVIMYAIESNGILCKEIGQVGKATKPPLVWHATPNGPEPLPRPQRDAIASLFDV